MIKEIYPQGTQFMKSPFYNGLNEGTPNLFDGINREAHKERRKLLGNAFAKSTIMDAEPLVVEQLQKFLGWVEKKEGTAMNVYAWFRMLSLDIVSSLLMGQAVGALDSDTEHEWQFFLTSQKRLYKYGKRSFDAYVAEYGRGGKRNDLLKRVLQGDKTVKPMTDEEICAQVGSQMIGGTDTTSVTLTYTTWKLAKQLKLQEKLRQELQNAGVPVKWNVLRYSDLENLPYLDAVVKEGLRLHPAAPASLPRIVPKGGARLSGIFVPEDTIVSMMNYSTHHNRKIFLKPFEFDPERWFNATQDMNEAYMPFSRGSRMCIGINLATMELKMIVASMIYGWELRVGERTTDDTMSITDHFVMMPKGGFCKLYLRKVT